MVKPNIIYHDAAILIWLPPGREPDLQTFDLKTEAVPPPDPNPEPWWTIRDAIIYAAELRPQDRHGKEPWIKWGHELLSPAEIMATYQNIKGA
jgi:hypothetical protein